MTEEKEELQKKEKELKDKWEAEKQAILRVRAVKKEIDQVKNEMELAERDYDLSRLSELRYGKLPTLALTRSSPPARTAHERAT